MYIFLYLYTHHTANSIKLKSLTKVSENSLKSREVDSSAPLSKIKSDNLTVWQSTETIIKKKKTPTKKKKTSTSKKEEKIVEEIQQITKEIAAQWKTINKRLTKSFKIKVSKQKFQTKEKHILSQTFICIICIHFNFHLNPDHP